MKTTDTNSNWKSVLLGCLFSLFLINCDEHSPTLETSNEGKVVHIVDGDTYDVILNGEQVRIRMEGIDAPERGMDFYKESKTFLGQLCKDQDLKLERRGTDRYGRTIARSYLSDGRELGAEMVRSGMAWHFKKYSSDTVLSTLEIEARIKHMGIWQIDNPEAPWDHRKHK